MSYPALAVPAPVFNEASAPNIMVNVLNHGDSSFLPAYATVGAAGADLKAAIPAGEPLTLTVGARALVPTGLSMALPEGWEAQIRPRSGLAFKNGVTVLNSPGTIDSDYRGEICVLLINHGDKPFVIERGDRIAQMIISPIVQASFQTTDILPESVRGVGGFGSTGTK
jgi:dUTP pyrophosphatase